jgi:cell division septation protein DedD
MPSGGKRSGAGERVLESRHVIGLFLIMMLFSAGFFTLGYLMGRDQNSGAVQAATDLRGRPEVPVAPKPEPVAKRTNNKTPADTPTDSSAPPNSDWEFYHAGDAKKPEDHLKSAASSPTQTNAPVLVRTTAPPRTAGSPPKPATTPLIPGGGYTLQVAALTKEADAMELATRLQKNKFPAFVLSPKADKYYRVQVGPYADQKAADVARKGLEGAGFKAIVKH